MTEAPKLVTDVSSHWAPQLIEMLRPADAPLAHEISTSVTADVEVSGSEDTGDVAQVVVTVLVTGKTAGEVVWSARREYVGPGAVVALLEDLDQQRAVAPWAFTVRCESRLQPGDVLDVVRRGQVAARRRVL